MNGLTSMLGRVGMKLNLALLELPRYIVREDGTYEVVKDAVEAYSAEPVSKYVSLPASYRYYIPWDIDILYEGINMLEDLLRYVVPAALWMFLIISGVYLAVSIIRSLCG